VASSVHDLLEIIVGVVHELTAFHCCMIYQIRSIFNGKVVAELVNPHASSDFYKGLHFPATDKRMTVCRFCTPVLKFQTIITLSPP